jgi:hypothetical protein
MEAKRPVVIYLCLMVLIIVSVIARQIILGGSPQIKLTPAAPLSGVVSESLANLGQNGSLPIEGKDYTLHDVRYFNNRAYAVVSVTPLSKATDASTLVLKAASGTYQVVLGPGTAFSNSDVQGLPADVTQYLKTKVVVYEPAN